VDGGRPKEVPRAELLLSGATVRLPAPAQLSGNVLLRTLPYVASPLLPTSGFAQNGTFKVRMSSAPAAGRSQCRFARMQQLVSPAHARTSPLSPSTTQLHTHTHAHAHTHTHTHARTHARTHTHTHTHTHTPTHTHTQASDTPNNNSCSSSSSHSSNSSSSSPGVVSWQSLGQLMHLYLTGSTAGRVWRGKRPGPCGYLWGHIPPRPRCSQAASAQASGCAQPPQGLHLLHGG
jgi:hypothetical protein